LVWPGVRQAGLVKAEPGADAGPGAAQRSRLDDGEAVANKRIESALQVA
jgi:hypothetical protein